MWPPRWWANPVRGQEVISRWSQYSGWVVMLTAPILGASIDNLGRRKTWLAAIVALMVPLMAALWFTKADHTGLSVTQTLAITTTIGVLFTWSEVLHNSLLVRAAGLSGAHKASGLALALGNAFAPGGTGVHRLGLRPARTALDRRLGVAAPRAPVRPQPRPTRARAGGRPPVGRDLRLRGLAVLPVHAGRAARTACP